MEYKEATKIAQKYYKLLAPACERIEIAGSIRRKKNEVHDIEIVVIPKKVLVKYGLFESSFVVCKEFVAAVNSLEYIKGQPQGKYCQRKTPEGINLDIFIADKQNWGYILALRTGSDKFNIRMVKQAKRNGFQLQEGRIYDLHGSCISVEEEQTFFRICREQYIQPEFRVA